MSKTNYMPLMRLSVATLVSMTETKPRKFIVKPLFYPEIEEVQPHIEDANEKLKESLVQLIIQADKRNEALKLIRRIGFHPKFNCANEKMTLYLGKKPIEGTFTMVTFEVAGNFFLLLPGFKNHLSVFKANELDDFRYSGYGTKVITNLLKAQKAESGAQEFSASQYFSPQKEFLGSIDVEVLVSDSFDEIRSGYGSARNSSAEFNEFDGSQEMARIGKCYNPLFPNSLKRSLFREQQLQELSHALLSPNSAPVALIGPAGVGRHTLFEEVVFTYLEEHQHSRKEFLPKKFWHVDPSRIIAGMNEVGMWQKRFDSMLRYLTEPADTHLRPFVMMMDNPLALIRAGRYVGGNMAVSDALRPYLEDCRLPFLLISTPEEWSLLEEQDRRFSGLFQVIRLEEPSALEMWSILLNKRASLENKYQVNFFLSGLDQLIQIHRRYLSAKALPGSLIQMLEQLAIKFKNKQVDEYNVQSEFQLRSGLSEVFLDDTQTLEVENMKEFLANQLVGQPEATQAILSVAYLIKSRLTRKNKPISSLLFTGPTGVGKTQAAKALSQLISGSESSLIRFDMNEYSDWGAVQRLVGDFSKPDGQLTMAVRQQPFAVLLLDEIEKANPKVHDLLLQLLDDARLTDGAGQTTDFSNTIVIMTSNLGAREASSALGFAPAQEDLQQVFVKAVEQFFRPELVNRIDHIIPFRPLDEEQVFQIARLQLRELLQRDGFVRRTCILNVDTQTLRWVSSRGFDHQMGGRALKRQIERDLTELSADLLINTPHDSTILFNISLENGRITPQIQTFGMVPSISPSLIPQAPEESKSRVFLQKLHLRVGAMLRKMKDSQSESHRSQLSSQDMDYYEVLERVEHLNDHLKNILLSFTGNYLSNVQFSSLRLKSGLTQANNDEKENLRQKIFGQNDLHALQLAYTQGLLQFNQTQSGLIGLLQDTALTEREVEGYLNSADPEVRIIIRSLVQNDGEEENRFLTNIYENFLRHAGYDFQSSANPGTIQAKGYGLMDILGPENGIHLFKTSFGTLLPIQVSVFPARTGEQPSVFDILRIYHKPRLIHDLRSGFFNDWHISPQETRFFLFAGTLAKNTRE